MNNSDVRSLKRTPPAPASFDRTVCVTYLCHLHFVRSWRCIWPRISSRDLTLSCGRTQVPLKGDYRLKPPHGELIEATELLAKCASRYENAPDAKYKETPGYKAGARRA